jgi:hypothetical protein
MLEVERELDPVEGRLWVGDGSPQPFTGWIGLMSCLTVALEASRKSETP